MMTKQEKLREYLRAERERCAKVHADFVEAVSGFGGSINVISYKAEALVHAHMTARVVDYFCLLLEGDNWEAVIRGRINQDRERMLERLDLPRTTGRFDDAIGCAEAEASYRLNQAPFGVYFKVMQILDESAS